MIILYTLLSTITFVVYGFDKLAAQRGGKRAFDAMMGMKKSTSLPSRRRATVEGTGKESHPAAGRDRRP